MRTDPALVYSDNKDEPAGAYLDSTNLGSWETWFDAIRAGDLFETVLLSTRIGYFDSRSIDGDAILLDYAEYKITTLRVREGAKVFEVLSRTAFARFRQFALEIQR